MIAGVELIDCKLTPEQQETFDDLEECGQEVYVWRPADIVEIAAVLGLK